MRTCVGTASVDACQAAQLVLGAVIEAALVITHAADRDVARAEAERALLTLLSGMIQMPAGERSP